MTLCALNMTSCTYTPYEFSSTEVIHSPPSKLFSCTPETVTQIQHELFQFIYIVGETIQHQPYKGIGPKLLANRFTQHPYLHSIQEKFSHFNHELKRLKTCSFSNILSAIKRTWFFFKQSLKENKVFEDARSSLYLNHESLGAFQDTSLIISQNSSSFTHVVTHNEFTKFNSLYQRIISDQPPFKIHNETKFKSKVAKAIRKILSTQIGRDLFDAVKEHSLLIKPHHEFYLNCSTPILALNTDQNAFCYYGSPNKELIQASESLDQILFHELIHFFHTFILNCSNSFSKYPYSKFPLMSREHANALWGNLEEERTILKTNLYRRQIGLGDMNWNGRWSHLGKIKGEEKNFFFSLLDLFAINLRIYDEISVFETKLITLGCSLFVGSYFYLIFKRAV